MMSLIDPTMQAVGFALDGLSSRQRLIAQNIANAETPGYTAQRVDFESSLRRAIAAGDPAQAQLATSNSSGEVGLNGNNVAVDEENVALQDANLAYQMMSEAMNAKFLILRTSMRRD